MASRISLGVGRAHAQDMARFHCLRPPGSFVVGWIDYESDKDRKARPARCYALVLLRSGRVMASRGSDIRAVPEDLFSFIRLRCAS